MPIKFDKNIKALLKKAQDAWEPLKEPKQLANEDALVPFNAATGMHDRKHAPEKYLQNAATILDFLILQTPQILEEVTATCNYIATAITAVPGHMKARINPACYYLNPNHCIPDISSLEQNENLYCKMLLLEWLLTELEQWYKTHPGTLGAMVDAVINFSVNGEVKKEVGDKISWLERKTISLMPSRKRLPTVTNGIDAYAIKHNLKRPTIDEIKIAIEEKKNIKDLIKKPEANVDAKVLSAETKKQEEGVGNEKIGETFTTVHDQKKWAEIFAEFEVPGIDAPISSTGKANLPSNPPQKNDNKDYVLWVENYILKPLETEKKRHENDPHPLAKVKAKLFSAAHTEIRTIIQRPGSSTSNELHTNVTISIKKFAKQDINGSKNPVYDYFMVLLGVLLSSLIFGTPWYYNKFRNCFWNTRSQAVAEELVERTTLQSAMFKQ